MKKNQTKKTPWGIMDLHLIHTDFSENLIPSDGDSSEGVYINEFVIKSNNPLYRVQFAEKDYFAVNLPFVPKKWGDGNTVISIAGTFKNIEEITLESFDGVTPDKIIKITDDRLISTFYVNNDVLDLDITISCYALSSSLNSREVNTLINEAQQMRLNFDEFKTVTFEEYKTNVIGSTSSLEGTVVENIERIDQQLGTVEEKLVNLKSDITSSNAAIGDQQTILTNHGGLLTEHGEALVGLSTSISDIGIAIGTIINQISNLETQLEKDIQDIATTLKEVTVKIKTLEENYRPIKISLVNQELTFTELVRVVIIKLDTDVSIPWYAIDDAAFIRLSDGTDLLGLSVIADIKDGKLKTFTVGLTGDKAQNIIVDIIKIIA